MKFAIPVIALLALALALRLALLFSLEGKPLVSEPILDSAAYDSWAQDIATRSFWGDRVFYQDPLYPYGLGIFYKIFGRHLLAIKILQALLGVAGLAMLFEAARRMAGYSVAVATLAVAAVYRTTAFYDVVLLKEFLGPFFLEAALLTAVLAVQEKRWWWWFLTGLSIGLASLVRGNLLILAPVLAVAFFFMRERRGAGLVLAGALVAILPCTIRNAVVGREFVLTTAQAGQNLYIGNNAENWTGRYRTTKFMPQGAPEFEEADFRREAERRTGVKAMSAGAVSSFWRGEALDAIREQPWHFLGATWRRAMMLSNDWEAPDNFNITFLKRFSTVLALPWMTFGLVLWPLAAAGLYLSWIERRKHVLPYVMLAGALVPIAFFFVFDRYRLPAIPILCFFAGYAIVKIAETIKWKMRRVPVIAGGVAVAFLIHANLPIRIYGVGRVDFFTQHYMLGGWYGERGDFVRAANESDNAFQLRPEARQDPRLATVVAPWYEKAGRTPEALPLFTVAQDHAGLARCYGALRNYALAAEHFAVAVTVEPDNLDLQLSFADALSRSGRRYEAIDSLATTAKRFPDDARPWLARARIYRDIAMWREAVQSADEALRRDPLLAEARAIREEALQK